MAPNTEAPILSGMAALDIGRMSIPAARQGEVKGSDAYDWTAGRSVRTAVAQIAGRSSDGPGVRCSGSAADGSMP
jgi:hypothetical protein